MVKPEAVKRLKAARRSSAFRLTRKERAILADPDWVTEDEADVIYCMRHEHEPTTLLELVRSGTGEKGISQQVSEERDVPLTLRIIHPASGPAGLD